MLMRVTRELKLGPALKSMPTHSVHMDEDPVHKEINDSVHKRETSQDQWDAPLLIAEPARRNRQQRQ